MNNSTNEVVQDIVKKRRRPDLAEKNSVHLEPGENTKYIRHNFTVMKWEKPDMTDNNAVEDRVNQYFSLCMENDVKPSVEGMALAFGVERKTVWRWVNGLESKSIPEEVRNTIKKAYGLLNTLMSDYMQNGKINPVSGIFLMKNNMGYKDETDIIISPNQPLGEIQQADVIADKYKLLPSDPDLGSD